MAATSSNAVNIIMQLLAENIGQGVTDYTVYGDRILDAIVLSNRVQRAGFLGRNDNVGGSFRAHHRIKLSRAGDWGATALNKTTTTLTDAAQIPAVLGVNNTRLDPTKIPQQTIKDMFLDLKRIEGNVVLDLDQIYAMQYGQVLADFVTDMADDQIKNVRDACATIIFGDAVGKLGVLVSPAATITEATQVALTISGSSVRRFVKGQRYVIADGAAYPSVLTIRDSPGGGTNLICNNIDYTTLAPNAIVVYFVSAPGEGTIDAIANGDVLLKANTFVGNVAHLPDGFDSLIAATGTLHGLSRTDNQELKSIVSANGGTLRAPEPRLVTNILSAITHAGFQIPTLLIAQKDVRDRYFQIEQQRSVYNVPMRMAFADGGMGVNQTSYEGRVLAWIESSFVGPNRIIGVSPEKMIRYAPAGAESIQWFLAGGGSAYAPQQFMHVLASNGSIITNLVQAPYQYWVQFGVTEPMSHFQLQDLQGAQNV